jgi:hypothetical protein
MGYRVWMRILIIGFLVIGLTRCGGGFKANPASSDARANSLSSFLDRAGGGREAL